MGEGLKNVRFSRDAIDAVGWRGKLCIVNAKGDAAKEGSVHDTEKDTWEDMPEGMLARWKGPVQPWMRRRCNARVFVVCSGSNNTSGIAALDVVVVPVRLWIVETPPRCDAMAIHILPRISQPDQLVFNRLSSVR
ncbi:hypothetical protein GH714_019996 [Hevea brasiliensis]|uniref:Uncharacterized protein n=1 Tax=Hevea brasiliensis TaxID=3981 RepID=A0A6A6M7G5_HEVBR|nr:hypothetical protein GH714_019996 [Hevea brasiliensis]